MSTLMEQKIKKALEKKDTDITSFVWKGSKKLDENKKYRQSEKRMVDMNEVELNYCYNHCKTMLFNNDSKDPGRYLVLEHISEQKDKCGIELCLRYLDQEKEISRFSLMTMLTEFLSNNKEALKGINPLLSHVFSGLPDQFSKLPINLAIDGCLDRLGAFNKKHITRAFILKQGIWLTPKESKDLIKYAEGDSSDRLSLIRENLGVKDVEILYLNSTGLNYTQMRAMLNIKPNRKYIDLTTVQLETLRYRVLFNLEENIRRHIQSWEKRMEQIQMVANYKNFKLN